MRSHRGLDREPACAACLQAHRHLMRAARIQAPFPEHALLTEEAGAVACAARVRCALGGAGPSSPQGPLPGSRRPGSRGIAWLS